MTRARLVDLAVATAVIALVLLDKFAGFDDTGLSTLHLVCGLVAGLLTVVRRDRPLLVLAAVTAVCILPTLVTGVAPDLYASFLPFLVLGYTVAAHCTRRQSWAVPVAEVVAYAVFAGRSSEFRSVPELLFNLVVTVAVYAAGRSVRALRARVDLESARAEVLQREQDVSAREAVVLERERIARELHDVIAHDVSVMVIHAAAAQRLGPDQAPEVVEALTQIQDSGRKAIDELYLLLGMLRGDDSALDPQPGVDSIDDLVEDVRRSGVDVTLRVEGEVRPVGGALGVSAYRVVQESLTNVLKHAGASRVEVVLEYAADELTVRVADDGPGTTSPLVPSGGHGLLGMRERVRMFGGALTAGAVAGGGWSVTAVLPTAGETA